MKTKDQHNQNPEEVVSNQEENSLTQDEAKVSKPRSSRAKAAEKVTVEASEPIEAHEPVTLAEDQIAVNAETEEITDKPETSDGSTESSSGQEPVTLEEPVKEEVVEKVQKPKKRVSKASSEEPVTNELVKEEADHQVKDLDQTSILLEHTEEEESDEIEEIHEEEPNKALQGYTREQLVEKLEELVKDSNVNAIKTDVAMVKVAFLKLNKEFKHDEYQKLVEQNVEPDAETPIEAPVTQDDPLEERFKAAFNIYKTNKAKYNEEQEKVKIQNLEAKNQILEELKVLINSEETLKKTYDEFKNLQERWKTIGMVPKNEINTLWQNYHFLVEKFFDKVKINKELKDLDLKKNLEAKMQLCEKAEELLLETSIIKSFKQLQQYHEEWKEIGPVPQDKKDELWERFKSATEKINERRREYYSEVQDGQEQNLAAKQILCEKAEQVLVQDIDSIKGWQDASNQITELLKIWKTIGPAPKKQNNEIWARFKSSLDNFFNAKKEFFNKLKEQQMHNYNLKLDLCLQAESLKNSTDWKNTTRELINLQAEWKKIGPVPRKQSDRIWKRFRAACDEFFSSKTDYFKNIQSHEDENLKLKQDLIEKVKAFEIGDDRNQAIEALKDFQRQWMEIGFIPIKEKERLQNEFRNVINKHFEKLKMDSVAIGAQNYRSRLERISKDAPDANRVISKERNFLIGKIQQLQEDIKLWENNIGFFAASKTANLLKSEFEKKISKAKEELVMFEAKLKMLRESN
ncbi:MAG TPA: DUF349 domain-containing protein [Lentimicrobium sp.]|nr:DUF349 domain-containing protein [Lentimicrobium sp.]